jgi:hypothetical protein
LEQLGISLDLDSFSERKRIQKMVYLLRQFGAEDLKFRYNWYIHGPYSPDLTKVLFNPSDESEVSSTHDLSKKDLQIINNARNFLGEDFFSVDSLELLVSLVFLIRNGPKGGIDTRKKIFSYLRDKKPRFSEEQVEAAWAKIEKSGNWTANIATLKS